MKRTSGLCPLANSANSALRSSKDEDLNWARPEMIFSMSELLKLISVAVCDNDLIIEGA
jgi:hypothetical protein